MTTLPSLLTFAALAATSPAFPIPAQAPPAARVKWEYKSLSTGELQDLGAGRGIVGALNQLGEDGWELVVIEPGHVPPPVRQPRYIFKRPK